MSNTQIITGMAEHIRQARDGAESLRALHQAAGESTRQQMALVIRRALEQAVSARVAYDMLEEGAPPAAEPAPGEPGPIEPEPTAPRVPTAAPSPHWTVPADAEIRYLKPGQTILELRNVQAPVGKWIVYDLQGEMLQWLHIRNDCSGIAVINGAVAAQDLRGEAIRIVGERISRIRLVDLQVADGHTGMVISSMGDAVGDRMRDVAVLRCRITSNFTEGRGGHSQGLYGSGIDGFTIWGCLFDENGWTIEDQESDTIFNHNVYLSYVTDTLIENNIFSRASSFGNKFRSDRTAGMRNLVVRNNLYVECANGITMGSAKGVIAADQDHVIELNVFTRLGRNLSSGDQSFGYDGSSLERVAILDNLYVDKPTRWGGHDAIRVVPTEYAKDVIVRGNRLAGWNGNSWDLHAAVTASDNTIAPTAAATIDDWAREHGFADWAAARDAMLAGEAQHEAASICAWLRRQHGMLN